MNEKDLLQQLKDLKNVKPESQWQETNREVLLSQLSAGGDFQPAKTYELGWFSYFKDVFSHQFAHAVAHPVWTVAAIMVVVFGSGVLSINAARDTKPGDSLYIAKIISEKTQLVVTFNEKEKAKLSLEFAGNRAKEISKILSETKDNNKKEAQVEKLTQNFRKEINTAKTRLQSLRVKPDAVQPTSQQPESQDFDVFSANLGKDDKGVQIYIPGTQTEPSVIVDNVAEDAVPENTESEPALVTEDQLPAIAPEVLGSDTNDIQSALNEAEELFNTGDYNGTLTKLENINSLIDQPSAIQGQEGQLNDNTEIVEPEKTSEAESGQTVNVAGSPVEEKIKEEEIKIENSI